MLTYVHGDATRPRSTGPIIVVHAVNDVHKWGAGFVVALSRRWPDARAGYLSHPAAIGSTRIAHLEPNIYLANLVCLHGLHSQANPRRSATTP